MGLNLEGYPSGEQIYGYVPYNGLTNYKVNPDGTVSYSTKGSVGGYGDYTPAGEDTTSYTQNDLPSAGSPTTTVPTPPLDQVVLDGVIVGDGETVQTSFLYFQGAFDRNIATNPWADKDNALQSAQEAIINIPSATWSTELYVRELLNALPPGCTLVGYEIEVEAELVSGSVDDVSTSLVHCEYVTPAGVGTLIAFGIVENGSPADLFCAETPSFTYSQDISAVIDSFSYSAPCLSEDGLRCTFAGALGAPTSKSRASLGVTFTVTDSIPTDYGNEEYACAVPNFIVTKRSEGGATYSFRVYRYTTSWGKVHTSGVLNCDSANVSKDGKFIFIFDSSDTSTCYLVQDSGGTWVGSSPTVPSEAVNVLRGDGISEDGTRIAIPVGTTDTKVYTGGPVSFSLAQTLSNATIVSDTGGTSVSTRPIISTDGSYLAAVVDGTTSSAAIAVYAFNEGSGVYTYHGKISIPFLGSLFVNSYLSTPHRGIACYNRFASLQGTTYTTVVDLENLQVVQQASYVDGSVLPGKPPLPAVSA